MSEDPKYKGVPIKEMTREQIDIAFAGILEELTDEQLDLVIAEIHRIIAARPAKKAA